MRKETQSPKVICASCKQPIEPEQRPSVQLTPGEEVHMECWEERESAAGRLH